jgi:hypothetical protein
LELFKLFGTVIVEAKDAIEALQDTSKQAEKTSDSVGEVGNESKKAGKTTTDSMIPIPPKFSKIAKAGAVVVGAFTAIYTAANALAESTREYRLEMGKLETAFTTAGHTTEEATATYQEFYSILGETDRAVEVSQHIAKLCANEEEMKTMTDACIGAFAMFDDSLPIEGLVEAANETAKTGQLTGVLADALNWAGSSEEEFQKKLDKCNTERERTTLILDEMTDLYADAADAYKKNNKDVISAMQAQEKINAATARFGAIVEPLVTLVKDAYGDALNYLAGELEFFFGITESGNEELLRTSDAMSEAADKVESLREQVRDFNKTPPVIWTAEHQQQKEELTTALAEAEAEYYALVEAERLAAEESARAAEASAASVAQYSEVTDQYVADAMALFESFGQTYESIYSKVTGFFEPFEKASISVKTSVNDMMAAMQSQVEFNNTYSANLEKLKEYGLGSLSDAFQSYGANGSAYAAEIVAAVEKAGGATTEQGQAIIQGFQDINQQVTESQEGLSQTMTLMDGEFEKQLNDMVEKYGIAIEDLDKSAESSAAAISTFQAFLDGMNKKLPEIQSQMKKFGQKITSSLQSGIGDVNIKVNIKTNGSIPGYETGLDYVPYDNYLAYLHKGEAVLTAEEAAAWRAGKEVATSGSTGDSGSGGGVTVNQYIESVPQTPVELASATAAYFEQARWIT